MRKKAFASVKQASSRLAFLGPPPLIDGEDSNAYDELLARVSGAVKPSDIFEEIWVCDIVDLTWEVFRLRRLKASFLTVAMSDGVMKVLRPLLSYRRLERLPDELDMSDPQEAADDEQDLSGEQEEGDEVDAKEETEVADVPDVPALASGYFAATRISAGWAARDRDAIEEAKATITSAGLTMDAVMAQTLVTNIKNVDWIDRMIVSAGERRDAILREINRHRSTLAERLRRVTEEIEDAEFRVVPGGKDQVRSAA
jgi:hypothetical protein